MTRSTRDVLAAWHEVVASGDPTGLQPLLDEDCVFLSPVVHSPQRGRSITAVYLAAAMQVFEGNDFTYVAETVDEQRAVLEFTCDLDGTMINGVDLIDVRDGRIVRFTVMVRPMRGMDELRRRMAARLADATGGAG